MTHPTPQVPAVGDPAPGFTLKDADGHAVSLDGFRGKTVVLLFFPAAFTSTCTAELCTIRDNLTRLNACDAVALGISTDSPPVLARFAASQGIEYPLLSDFDRQAIMAYGIPFYGFFDFTSAVAKRAVFVIDAEGRIAWEWIGSTLSVEPPYAEVLQAAAGC